MGSEVVVLEESKGSKFSFSTTAGTRGARVSVHLNETEAIFGISCRLEGFKTVALKPLVTLLCLDLVINVQHPSGVEIILIDALSRNWSTWVVFDDIFKYKDTSSISTPLLTSTIFL